MAEAKARPALAFEGWRPEGWNRLGPPAPREWVAEDKLIGLEKVIGSKLSPQQVWDLKQIIEEDQILRTSLAAGDKTTLEAMDNLIKHAEPVLAAMRTILETDGASKRFFSDAKLPDIWPASLDELNRGTRALNELRGAGEIVLDHIEKALSAVVASAKQHVPRVETKRRGGQSKRHDDLLVGRLADLYEEWTGQQPAFSGRYDGPFYRFLEGVHDILPLGNAKRPSTARAMLDRWRKSQGG